MASEFALSSAPEVAAFVLGALVLVFILIVVAAVWGWGHGRKFEKKHQSTMSAIDAIAAEPGEAEQWPKSSN